MTFEADAGHASERGPRPGNEDFAGVVLPPPHEREHGLVAALADGVSTGGRGLEAAQTAVISLLADYFATPPTWDTTVALDRVIGAQNSWLAHTGAHRGQGMTALTALVLRGHSWTLAHVGDTRAYLLAPGRGAADHGYDHRFDHPDRRSQLTRALGLDDAVRLDYLQGEVLLGDCFVLMSDGVHGALKPRARTMRCSTRRARHGRGRRAALVAARSPPVATTTPPRWCCACVGWTQGGSKTNACARHQLPVPPRLRVGETVDGFTVTALVADNGVHLLYQVRDAATQRRAALKTLHPARAGDAEERAMLAHEAWLAQRVSEHGSPAARAFVAAHAVAQADRASTCCSTGTPARRSSSA